MRCKYIGYEGKVYDLYAACDQGTSITQMKGFLTDCSLEWRNMGGYKVITYNS